MKVKVLARATETAKEWLEQIPNPLNITSSSKLIQYIDLLVNFISKFGVLLATIAILVGGYFILSSAGEEQKVKSGKKIIIIAAICLVFIFLLSVIKEGIVKFLKETFQ